MVWKHNRNNSILHSIVRSRIFMGLLCLVFLFLSVNVHSKNCHAFEMKKAHKNHFSIAPIIKWNHSSMPSLPSGNSCPCDSSVNACCNSAPSNTSKFLISTLYTDTFCPISILQTALIKPVDYSPLKLKYKDSHHTYSFLQYEFFLINCTFLI